MHRRDKRLHQEVLPAELFHKALCSAVQVRSQLDEVWCVSNKVKNQPLHHSRHLLEEGLRKLHLHRMRSSNRGSYTGVKIIRGRAKWRFSVAVSRLWWYCMADVFLRRNGRLEARLGQSVPSRAMSIVWCDMLEFHGRFSIHRKLEIGTFASVGRYLLLVSLPSTPAKTSLWYLRCYLFLGWDSPRCWCSYV